MRILGLETAGEMGGVGVVDGAHMLSELSFEARADHGAKLTPAVDAALQLAGLTRTEVDLVAVSQGPGSFTGLRIGVAFAKGLARAIESPLVGVPTLDPYAERVRFWPGRVWVLFPDRRASVYRAIYEHGQLIDPPATLPVDALVTEWASDDTGHGPLIIGPGMENHRDALQRALPSAGLGSAALACPSGATVARLGRERFERGRPNGLYELEPLYAQGPPVMPVSHSRRASV